MPIVIRIPAAALEKKAMNGPSKPANIFKILLIRTLRLIAVEFGLAFLAVIAGVIAAFVSEQNKEVVYIVAVVGASLMLAAFLVSVLITIFKVIRVLVRKKN